jgi:membrane-bound lytic murein transglycosylase F
MRLPVIPLIGLCAALLTACSPPQPTEPPLTPWREEMVVVVAQDQNSVDAEFQQRLITGFAEQHQLKVRLVPLPANRVAADLLLARAHFAAAGMRANASGALRFTPSYQTVNERIVCLSPLRRLQDATGTNITVLAGSAQDDALHELRQKLPELTWQTKSTGSVADLLNDVADGKLECTVANEAQLSLARHLHPDLVASTEIVAASKLAWSFAPDSDEELFSAAEKYFTAIRRDGTLDRLLDRYYGHNERLEPVGAAAFLTATRTDLPRYRHIFEEAEQLTGIDWRLLAALAYQESHWDPFATSYTNVRGMMMLTESTADHMGVDNRLDAHASILGGARYLALLRDQLPARIPEGERIWFALAAYNQGPAHLEDARMLTAQAGANPNSWVAVKKFMPRLAQPEYAEQTKYGYARGGEAVALVETVHLYYDMLKRIDAPKTTAAATESPFRLHMPDVMKYGFGQ